MKVVVTLGCTEITAMVPKESLKTQISKQFEELSNTPRWKLAFTGYKVEVIP